MVRESTEANQALGEHDVEHARQQQGVRPRPDGDMLAGGVRGFGAARVDHDDAAPAFANGAKAAFDVGSGHEAALGHDRIGAEDEEQVGPVQIRYRNERLMAEHSKRDEHLRELIRRARGIHVSRAHRARERQRVGHQTKAVSDRIAIVNGRCVAAVSAADPHQPIGSPIQCVFPRHLEPTSALTDHRSSNAIGIFMKIEQRRSLGADVAAAERIVRIAADRSQLSVFSVDQDAARGFAERTDRGSHNTSFYRPHESHEWPRSH